MRCKNPKDEIDCITQNGCKWNKEIKEEEVKKLSEIEKPVKTTPAFNYEPEVNLTEMKSKLPNNNKIENNMMMVYIIAFVVLVLLLSCVVTCFLCRSEPKKKK